jgi:hypothetical protein
MRLARGASSRAFGDLAMSALGYILLHPVEAGRTFWRAFTGTETLADRIEEEEARLRVLRTAIGLYHISLGNFPKALKDLCYNNHHDLGWSGEFIRWRGEDTFLDSFGFPYRYSETGEQYDLISPGLETAKKSKAE